MACAQSSWGSSPLTRGAQIEGKGTWSGSGLIPAHAGSTLWPVLWRLISRAHPRSRGEHLTGGGEHQQDLGSSPLTRGALAENADIYKAVRLIPAHAGSTSGVEGHAAQTAAHPRSRGEHRISERNGEAIAGSSPLTRGALDAVRGVGDSAGLIPAHAGSTRMIWSN